MGQVKTATVSLENAQEFNKIWQLHRFELFGTVAYYRHCKSLRYGHEIFANSYEMLKIVLECSFKNYLRELSHSYLNYRSFPVRFVPRRVPRQSSRSLKISSESDHPMTAGEFSIFSKLLSDRWRHWS